MEKQLNSIQMLVTSRRRAIILNYVLTLISILSIVVAIIASSREDKVIVLDANGKPYVAVTFKDNVYPIEVQNFIRDALQVTLEWTYTEIIENQKRQEHLKKMQRYFHPDFFPKFIGGFKNSDYITDIVNEKKITKTSFSDAFNVYKDKKRDVFVASGKVIVTAYGITGKVTSEDKVYKVEMVRGMRNVFNPYGLYIVGLTEVLTK